MRPDLPPSPSIEWRVSSFCAGGECIEVAAHDGMIMMRDRVGPHVLTFTVAEWRAFASGVRAGEFDDLLDGERA